MGDIMKIEVLPDGRVKVITDSVSMANHMSAEKFLKTAKDFLGGIQTREHRKGFSHIHTHADGTTHSHN